jgi:hypothetical protein
LNQIIISLGFKKNFFTLSDIVLWHDRYKQSRRRLKIATTERYQSKPFSSLTLENEDKRNQAFAFIHHPNPFPVAEGVETIKISRSNTCNAHSASLFSRRSVFFRSISQHIAAYRSKIEHKIVDEAGRAGLGLNFSYKNSPPKIANQLICNK